MRRTMRCLAPAVALIAAGWSVPCASAQDAHELERRLDAAIIARNEATAAVTSYRARAVTPRVFTDTIAVLGGSLRIITTREFLALAREAGTISESFIRRRAGGSISPLRGTTILIWADSLRHAEHGLVVVASTSGH